MYFYPDGNDVITAKMIEKIELFSGYWSFSESRLLNIVEKRYLPKIRNRMLDLGCGEGRLTLRYKNKFSEIIAIEPDESRFNRAKTHIEKTKENVEMFNGYYKDYEGRKEFDFILCSHILQHVSIITVKDILRDIHDGLTEKGICVLFTTHSKIGYTYHINAAIKDESYIEDIVIEEVFNKSLNQVSLLPTTIFDVNELNVLLEQTGLKLVKYYVFHLDNKKKPYKLFNDKSVNLFSFLKKTNGRDMMLIIEKKKRV